MILGRNTLQWTGLITSAATLIQILLVTLIPDIDAELVAIVIGAVVTFLGVAIAFIANTYTTPTQDPRLQGGTPVTITNKQGAILGHDSIPTVPTEPVR